jgi:hypothetical protein
MPSESVCQAARSWVDVGSFHTRFFGVMYFAIASVREFLDTPSYTNFRYCRGIYVEGQRHREQPQDCWTLCQEFRSVPPRREVQVLNVKL